VAVIGAPRAVLARGAAGLRQRHEHGLAGDVPEDGLTRPLRDAEATCVSSCRPPAASGYAVPAPRGKFRC
jgi:hypothetical protein